MDKSGIQHSLSTKAKIKSTSNRYLASLPTFKTHATCTYMYVYKKAQYSVDVGHANVMSKIKHRKEF